MSTTNKRMFEQYFDDSKHFKRVEDEAKRIWKLAAALTHGLCGLCALSVEVFLHRQIGERRIWAGGVLGALFIIGAVGGGGVFALGLAIAALTGSERWIGPMTVVWPNIYMFCFFVAALVHTGFIHKRHRQGVRWHSRSAGLPYGFWKRLPISKTHQRIVGVIEPAAIAITGFVLFVAGMGFGLYFIIAAIALVFRQYIEHRQVRVQLLDRLDAQIEGEHWEEILEEPDIDPAQTNGFVVPGITSLPPNQRRLLSEDLAMLEHKVRSAISTPANRVSS